MFNRHGIPFFLSDIMKSDTVLGHRVLFNTTAVPPSSEASGEGPVQVPCTVSEINIEALYAAIGDRSNAAIILKTADGSVFTVGGCIT